MKDSELIEICRAKDIGRFQEFLSSMDLEDKSRYISEVRYVEYQPEARFIHSEIGEVTYGKVLAKTSASIRGNFLIPNTKSRIIIYQKLFEDIPVRGMNVGDLYSVVVDHEGTHAKDFYEAPWKIGIFSGVGFHPRKIRAELRAFEEQERNFQHRGCSQGFMDRIRKSKIIAELQLYNLT